MKAIELNKDEKILYIAKQHWTILINSLLAVLVAFFIIYLGTKAFNLRYNNMVWIISVITAFVYMFYKYSMWNLNAFIITDQRVIDIEKKNILHKEVSSLNNNDIKEVTFKSKGFLESIFHFGTLRIESQSGGRIIKRKVSRPDKIQNIILETKRSGHSGTKGVNII